jgi:hypothetical protein
VQRIVHRLRQPEDGSTGDDGKRQFRPNRPGRRPQGSAGTPKLLLVYYRGSAIQCAAMGALGAGGGGRGAAGC